MTLNCIVVDDEPLALGLIVSYVKKTPFLNLIGSYSNAMDAAKSFDNQKPDLIFLDIQMPEMNGLEFSKLIGDKTKVIFTTAFQQYAIEGFKVNALDYLLKPISYTDFLQSAQKALNWFEMTNNANKSVAAPIEEEKKSIFVKTEYKLVQVELDKILYIEGVKDYVKIVLEDEPKSVLTLMSMRSLEEDLPSAMFVRVHRSFIVQPAKVKVIDKNRIVFGKQYIPISDSYKDSFFDFLENHSIVGYRMER